MRGPQGLPPPTAEPRADFWRTVGVLTTLLPTTVVAASPREGGTAVPLWALLLLALFVVALLGVTVICIIQRRRCRADSRIQEWQARRIETLQAQLIDREKLASLGQLTAGIAHEIKNPLNFVTNFSDVSRELIEELQAATTAEERDEILAALRQNLLKISEHGHRADEIVRGMMLHARGGSTVREPADLNALISESAHLAYHAMRAQQDGFNCTVELELEDPLPPPSIVRQDIARVLLNILQNAMQAVHQREKRGESGYVPRVLVRSAISDGGIEVTVEDNGVGVPAESRDRIFDPFYTTKEADKGTGLGLSIAKEIVETQHGGHIHVQDASGGGARFILSLPTS